jgi:hypothetical protein
MLVTVISEPKICVCCVHSMVCELWQIEDIELR